MQLKVFVATLMRRWYLLLIALVLTAVATLLTVDKVGPTYEAKAAVLFLPPAVSVQNESQSLGNPYLMLDGLSQVRDIVIHALMAKSTLDELCQQRADPAYEAMREGLCKEHSPDVTYEAEYDTNDAPVIIVTVEGDTATSAVIALGALTDRVPEILANLQAGLKLGANATITSTLLVADKKPESVHKNQIRAGIVAGAGTLGLSLLMIGLFDGLMAARRSRIAIAARDQVMSAELESEAEPANATAEDTTAEQPAGQDFEAEPANGTAEEPAEDTSFIWPLLIAYPEAEPANAVAQEPAGQSERHAAAAARA